MNDKLDVQTSLPRTVIGKIISNKMQNTVVVQVERKIKHPLYGKFIRRKTKLFAHDADGIGKEGATVVIKQCRPISKKKHWELIEILESSSSAPDENV